MNMSIERGQIFMTSYNGKGSEMAKRRPYVVVQNNIGNEYSSTVLCCPITSNPNKGTQPTQVYVAPSTINNETEGYILCESIFTFDKTRLETYVGRLTDGELLIVDKALTSSLGLKANETTSQKSVVTEELFFERYKLISEELLTLEIQKQEIETKIFDLRKEHEFLHSYVEFKTNSIATNPETEEKNIPEAIKLQAQEFESKLKTISVSRIKPILTYSRLAKEIFIWMRGTERTTAEIQSFILDNFDYTKESAVKAMSNALQYLKVHHGIVNVRKGVWRA